jgi:hypothetical protein
VKRYHVDEDDEIDADPHPVDDDIDVNIEGDADDESDYDMDYDSDSDLSGGGTRPHNNHRRKLPQSASYSLSKTVSTYDPDSMEAAESSALASLAALSSALPLPQSFGKKSISASLHH